MGEHKFPPREPPQEPEAWAINDAEVGKTFPIRDCTDEQLQRYFAIASQSHMNNGRQAIALIGASVEDAKRMGAIAFEIDRRKRSIAIATDLSQISGLRRQ